MFLIEILKQLQSSSDIAESPIIDLRMHNLRIKSVGKQSFSDDWRLVVQKSGKAVTGELKQIIPDKLTVQYRSQDGDLRDIHVEVPEQCTVADLKKTITEYTEVSSQCSAANSCKICKIFWKSLHLHHLA